MATFFRTKAVKEIGTVKVPVYKAGPSTTATIVGLSLANLTESVVSTSVLIADDTSIEAFSKIFWSKKRFKKYYYKYNV